MFLYQILQLITHIGPVPIGGENSMSCGKCGADKGKKKDEKKKK